MKYVIREIPPSDNKFKGRTNHWEYRNEKKRWLDMAYDCIRPVPLKPLEKADITITYFFPTRARHDPDNYSGKFILDMLTERGVIADDSFGCIELILRGDYDKENPRTEVEVKEKDDE